MMKHLRFSAREVMAWLRICRPGSVIGPQQAYLEQQESRMQRLGEKGVLGLGATMNEGTSSGSSSPKSQAQARESADAICKGNQKSQVSGLGFGLGIGLGFGLGMLFARGTKSRRCNSF
jgi:cell division cycle 14